MEINIFNTQIPITVKVKEAQSMGETINVYDKFSPASVAYTKFTEELMKYVGDVRG